MPAGFHTIVSTKGQVILPKTLRDQLAWQPGTRLAVENTPDGLLLRAAPAFPPTHAADVFGCIAHNGPPKTLDDMQAGIAHEIRRLHARD